MIREPLHQPKGIKNVLAASARAWLTPNRLAMYLIGVMIFSLGALFFIVSQLGTDPLDVFVIALNNHLKVGLGACSALFSVGLLLWWALWNKQWPPLSPFVTTTLTGLFIDLWLFLEFDGVLAAALGPYVLLAIGLGLCAYSSALIIMSGIGIRVIDLLVISMMNKLGWSFTLAKMVLEISVFVIGWLMGGPFGIGTIAFLLIIAPMIKPFMNMNERYLHMGNYGLKRRDPHFAPPHR
ncbi:YitT family protein [Pseudomonas sp. PH1b]|uniref:YczE/YyaS/YitT family protein n=1 Tax=Pseudomonas sp. PH1b TaxID=1397282 RepID=UPI00046AF4AD|nr:membrane protein [Pseudomonas sp. PH1b]